MSALNRTKVRVLEWARDAIAPTGGRSGERFSSAFCKFLRSYSEIAEASAFLRRNGYMSHAVTAKDWDLALILPEIGDGNFLDMGSSESYILKNLVRKRRTGKAFGIDLRKPDVPVKGVHYAVGDLMATGLPAGYFDYITCLSVIEHEVDIGRLARETERLLKPGGKLFISFDYWEPRVMAGQELYGLKWQPLDRADTERLISDLAAQNLALTQPMDWTLGEPVIRPDYYSPVPSISYTFGMAVFEKGAAEAVTRKVP